MSSFVSGLSIYYALIALIIGFAFTSWSIITIFSEKSEPLKSFLISVFAAGLMGYGTYMTLLACGLPL